jgi:hypothetical protein
MFFLSILPLCMELHVKKPFDYSVELQYILANEMIK